MSILGGIFMAKSTKELQARREVPEDRTWKLEDIFATDDSWEEELSKLKKDIPEITSFKGKLAESAETLYQVLKLQDDLSERLGKLYTYAHMRYDQDTTNSFYQ